MKTYDYLEAKHKATTRQLRSALAASTTNMASLVGPVSAAEDDGRAVMRFPYKGEPVDVYVDANDWAAGLDKLPHQQAVQLITRRMGHTLACV